MDSINAHPMAVSVLTAGLSFPANLISEQSTPGGLEITIHQKEEKVILLLGTEAAAAGSFRQMAPELKAFPGNIPYFSVEQETGGVALQFARQH